MKDKYMQLGKGTLSLCKFCTTLSFGVAFFFSVISKNVQDTVLLVLFCALDREKHK